MNNTSHGPTGVAGASHGEVVMGNKYEGSHIESHGQAQSADFIHRLCITRLRWPDPDVVKNRLMENKDRLLFAAIEWVFRNEQFLSWQHDADMGLLWIKGGPGKGKTMMTIGISERILSASDNPVLVTYFFCQNVDSQLNTVAAILKGLIIRLSSQHGDLRVLLQSRWDSKAEQFAEDMNVWQTLWDVFLEMLNRCSPRKVYVVIDALDECEDKEDLEDFLGRVVRRGLRQPRVKWLLTSRPLESAKQKLLTGSDQVGLSLELNSEHVARGVQAYIAARVLELGRGKDYGHDLSMKLEAKLTLKAEATFLWVSLVCKELEVVPVKMALSTLGGVPKGLVPLYQRAFQQLNGSREYEACKHILRVLMLAYRPLRVSELGGLTNNTKGEEAVRRLIHRCSSFVQSRNNSVEFVHQSARDYLGGKDGQSPLDSPSPYGHFELAMSCLSHLNRRLKVNLLDLPNPDSTWPSSNSLADGKAQKLLESLNYAATFWIQHLEDAQYSEVHQGMFAKGEVVSDFLHSKFLEWLECLALLGRLRVSVEGFRVLKAISVVTEPENDVSTFVQEATRFLLRHYSTIATWPLQIYSSAIIFTPRASMIRKENLEKTPSWLNVLPEVEDTWSPLIQTLTGHSSEVTAVAFTPNGTQLASASCDTTIKLWDATTGELCKTLIGHSSAVTAIAFLPNGTQLASTSSDGTIKLWDATTGELRKTLKGRSYNTTAIAFSPNGTQLASASSDGTIKLWDATTGELRKTLKGHSYNTTAIAFSPDGTQLASATGDNTIKLWDATTGKLRKTLMGHYSPVTAIAFSPNGTQLASASRDTTTKLWDATTGELRKVLIGHSSAVTAIAFSPNGTQLASASSDETIKLWSATTGELRNTLTGHSYDVMAVAFSPNGMQLASASRDETIKLWDATTGELSKRLMGHSLAVTAIAFSPNGTQLASASRDKAIKMWDPTTGELRKTLTGHSDWITDIAFSPDSTQLASASWDNTIKLWDATTGELRKMLEGHSSHIIAITFSPSGTHLASASSDKTIKLWDANIGELCKTLTGHSDWVTAIAFSSNGMQLASGSNDTTIKLWDLSPSKMSGFLGIRSTGSSQGSVGTICFTSSVKSLTYSADSSYLKTDRGAIELVSMAGKRQEDGSGAEALLSASEQWIHCDKSPIIRLPWDCALACSDSYGDVIVVGCKSGRLLRFELCL